MKVLNGSNTHEACANWAIFNSLWKNSGGNQFMRLQGEHGRRMCCLADPMARASPMGQAIECLGQLFQICYLLNWNPRWIRLGKRVLTLDIGFTRLCDVDRIGIFAQFSPTISTTTRNALTHFHDWKTLGCPYRQYPHPPSGK